MGFMIRRAEPSDWEACRAIRLRALLEEPGAFESEYVTEKDYLPEQWRTRLATGNTFLAFDDDHALVGTAVGLQIADGDTLVVAMYVTPEARGQGCAHLLLDRIADMAMQRQDKRLVLEATESNLQAAHSYRSYGFTETGRRWALSRDPAITEIELEFPLGD